VKKICPIKLKILYYFTQSRSFSSLIYASFIKSGPFLTLPIANWSKMNLRHPLTFYSSYFSEKCSSFTCSRHPSYVKPFAQKNVHHSLIIDILHM